LNWNEGGLNIALKKIPDQTEFTKGDLNQLAFNEQVLDIMKNADPMKYILDVFKKDHPGDRKVAKLLLLSVGCQSIINSDGIHVSIVGKSTDGKTHCSKIMSRLIPDRYIEKTELSPKAIFRLDGWEEGTVIFSNDVHLSEAMEDIIKRSIDCFKDGDDSYTVTISKLKNKTLKIPNRLTWWLTSVEGTKNDQVLNRFCTVKINESKEQDERVYGFQKKSRGKSFITSREVKLCRGIIQMIKNHGKFDVDIPSELINQINWVDKRNRRQFPMFLDMIKAFAVFNYMKRKTEDGKLIAKKRDVINAMELYNSIRGNIILDDDEKEIWDIIYRQNNLSEKISIEDIVKNFGKPKSTTKKILDRLMKKIPNGIISRENIAPPNGGRRYYYSTIYPPKAMKAFRVRWKP
jgi:predicted transcriptional regulator